MSSAPTAPERHFRGRLARTILLLFLPLSLVPLLFTGLMAVVWLAVTPAAGIYRQLNSLTIIATLLYIIIFLLVTLIIWQVIQRRLIQPLGQLTSAMQRFALGNWEERLPVEREDEIGLLTFAFNQIANELSRQYQALEMQIEQHSAQANVVAEIAQISISASQLDELLRRVVKLLVDHFGYTFAAIFLADPSGQYAILQEAAVSSDMEAHGLSAENYSGIRVRIDAPEANSISLVGWTINQNKARVISLEEMAPIQQINLLPGVQAEATIPLAAGEQVFGTLNIQVNDSTSLQEEHLAELQALANHIAASIQNFRLLAVTQVSLKETSLLYRASYEIAQSENTDQIFQVATHALAQTPYRSSILIPQQEAIVVYSAADEQDLLDGKKVINRWLPIPEAQIQSPFAMLSGNPGPVILTDFRPRPARTTEDLTRASSNNPADFFPLELIEWASHMDCKAVAFLPVFRTNRLAALLVLGANHKEKIITEVSENKRSSSTLLFGQAAIQPYFGLIELIATTLEKVEAIQRLQKGMNELQTLSAISQSLSQETNLEALFQLIHQQIRQVMGVVSFFIALYEPETNEIEIPYLVEDGQQTYVPRFPLGEGLTSILIRTRQPLMLVEGVEHWAKKLGAKTTGVPAKSWLGVPLLVSGEVLGAIVVQDLEREYRFSEDDQQLLVTLSTQVAAVLRNARLLDKARRQAERERLLYEITSKIRSSTDIKNILAITTTELAKVLGARQAQIELAMNPSLPPEDISAGHDASLISNTSGNGKGSTA